MSSEGARAYACGMAVWARDDSTVEARVSLPWKLWLEVVRSYSANSILKLCSFDDFAIVR